MSSLSDLQRLSNWNFSCSGKLGVKGKGIFHTNKPAMNELVLLRYETLLISFLKIQEAFLLYMARPGGIQMTHIVTYYAFTDSARLGTLRRAKTSDRKMWTPHKISKVILLTNLNIYGEAKHLLCYLSLDFCSMIWEESSTPALLEVSGECGGTDSPLRVL